MIFELVLCEPAEGTSSPAPRRVEVHEVPGRHVGILQEPQVQVLAEKLRECIARAL